MWASACRSHVLGVIQITARTWRSTKYSRCLSQGLLLHRRRRRSCAPAKARRRTAPVLNSLKAGNPHGRSLRSRFLICDPLNALLTEFGQADGSPGRPHIAVDVLGAVDASTSTMHAATSPPARAPGKGCRAAPQRGQMLVDLGLPRI